MMIKEIQPDVIVLSRCCIQRIIRLVSVLFNQIIHKEIQLLNFLTMLCITVNCIKLKSNARLLAVLLQQLGALLYIVIINTGLESHVLS